MEQRTTGNPEDRHCQPWGQILQPALASRGIKIEEYPLRVDSYRKNRIHVFSPGEVREAQTDPVTGLYTESNEIRNYLTTKLGESIINGSGWAIALSDADNLKVGNDQYNHDFGNTVIKYGVDKNIKVVNELQLSEGAQIFAIRMTSGADEVGMFFFNLTLEDQIKIDSLYNKDASSLEDPLLIQTEEMDSPFSYSISARATISSFLPEMLKEEVGHSKTWMATTGRRDIYSTYERIKNFLDEQVKAKKLEKQIDFVKNMPLIDLLTCGESFEVLHQALLREFGGRRISEGTLELLFRLVSFETALNMREHPQIAESIRDFLGKISPKELVGKLQQMSAKELFDELQKDFGSQT